MSRDIREISSDKAFFGFSPDLTGPIEVEQGEELLLYTLDCFGSQLQSVSDTLDELDWSITNPATGPLYIKGAKRGDILRVQLHEVRATGQSVMAAIPGEGGVGDYLTQPETAILENRHDAVIFKDKVTIPQRPMLGVIGVAPEEGTIPNSTPGAHGGNMDCKLVETGATLYFRVNVDGALFGCGDMHAVMGDGEILICGAETPGVVRLTLDVVALPGLPTPFLENSEQVVVIASAPSADEAAKQASGMMHEFLTGFANLTANDAAMLMSLVGELKFCQVVDPLVTVRFEFPKETLQDMGYDGFGA